MRRRRRQIEPMGLSSSSANMASDLCVIFGVRIDGVSYGWFVSKKIKEKLMVSETDGVGSVLFLTVDWPPMPMPMLV